MSGPTERREKDPCSREFVEDFSISEQDNLDFKALPLGDDLKCVVRRIVKDIAAMANSGGGYLVIGRDQQGERLVGAPKSLVEEDDSNIIQSVSRYLSPAPDLSKTVVTATDPGSKREVACVTLRIEPYTDFPCVMHSVVEIPDGEDPKKTKIEARKGDIFIRSEKKSIRVDTIEKVRRLLHPAIVEQARKLVKEVVGVVGGTGAEDPLEQWYEECRMRVRSMPHFADFTCYLYFWCSPEGTPREFELRELDDVCDKACPELIGGYGDRQRIAAGIQWASGGVLLSLPGLARLDRHARFFTCMSIEQDGTGGLHYEWVIELLPRWIGLVSKMASALNLERQWLMRVEMARCKGMHLRPLRNILGRPPQQVCNDEAIRYARSISLPANGNELREICEASLNVLFQNFCFDRFSLADGTDSGKVWHRVSQDVAQVQGFWRPQKA